MRAYIKPQSLFKKGCFVSDHAPGGLPRHPVRLAPPAPRQPVPFDLRPEAPARAALADELGITAVRKLAFVGTLVPVGRHDWTLTAQLGATVVQPCVVTLAPVTTRIDESVTRRFMADLPAPDPGETEMPDDDVDDLPASLDLWQVLAESLALALPAWPRAEGVEAVDMTVAEPGAEPLAGEAARPFAGLAALRGTLGDKDDSEG